MPSFWLGCRFGGGRGRLSPPGEEEELPAMSRTGLPPVPPPERKRSLKSPAFAGSLTTRRKPWTGYDFAGARALFAPVKERDFWGFPAAGLLYRRAGQEYYRRQVALADAKIKALDFEGANLAANQLAAYFPDDWRVNNLLFSSSDPAPYTGEVLHLFYHPLIAYPELAFDKKGNPAGEDNYMVTVGEFEKITRELYDKGYVLIDINSPTRGFGPGGDRLGALKPVCLPGRGKKPYILSVDDINYYDT